MAVKSKQLVSTEDTISVCGLKIFFFLNTVCFSYFVLTLEMIRQLTDVSHFIAHKLALAAGFRPLKSWPWYWGLMMSLLLVLVPTRTIKKVPAVFFPLKLLKNECNY